MDIRETRRLRLEQLLRQERFRGEKVELARAIGKAPAQVSQWCNRVRTISEGIARQIEERLKLPKGWMDVDAEATPVTVAPLIAAEPMKLTPAWPLKRITPSDLAQLTPAGLDKLETSMLARIDELLDNPRFGARHPVKQTAGAS